MAYMLVGYDRRETWETVLYRFRQMAARGIRPYPMVYGERRRGLPSGGYPGRVGHLSLADFQRWAVRKAYTIVPFEDYDRGIKGHLQPKGCNRRIKAVHLRKSAVLREWLCAPPVPRLFPLSQMGIPMMQVAFALLALGLLAALATAIGLFMSLAAAFS